MSTFPKIRMRRLRKNASLRNLVQEKFINLDKLVLPLFIKHGSNIKVPVASMPGHFQFSLDQLPDELDQLTQLGIKSVLLFGIPEKKDPLGQDTYKEDGIIQSAIRVIKQSAPEMLIISDLCFCEYTNHGHCGVIDEDGTVNNDETLKLLAKQAVSHAQAGSDIIAPSGNMDGMVQAVRLALDAANYHDTPILSYAVKYASSLYGPFRDAAEGAPKFGDRRGYQMNYGNVKEALRECKLDIDEGADMLMIKPAHTYLDVIHRVKETFSHLPLCAYHTSGEFAFLKAAAEKGWIDEQTTVMEVLTAMHRAGADFIITYYTKELAHWLRD